MMDAPLLYKPRFVPKECWEFGVNVEIYLFLDSYFS